MQRNVLYVYLCKHYISRLEHLEDGAALPHQHHALLDMQHAWPNGASRRRRRGDLSSVRIEAYESDLSGEIHKKEIEKIKHRQRYMWPLKHLENKLRTLNRLWRRRVIASRLWGAADQRSGGRRVGGALGE